MNTNKKLKKNNEIHIKSYQKTNKNKMGRKLEKMTNR